MTSHWRRGEPQFFDIRALEWGRLDGPPVVHGLDARRLSLDPESGNSTLMVRLPPGWRHLHRSSEATLELFVLEGELVVEGDAVGAGGYLFVPPGWGDVELRSGRGAQALLYWTPSLAAGDAPLRLARLWQEPWQQQRMESMPHGPMSKSLRLPDVVEGTTHGGPGGLLRLVFLPPGWADPTEHVHFVWEGLVFLAGDLAMPGRGLIAAGSYLGNPAEYFHGPMATQHGSLILVQTDEPVTQPAWPKRGAQEFANGYRERASWLDRPEHTPWAGLPDYGAAGRGLDWTDLPAGSAALLAEPPALT